MENAVSTLDEKAAEIDVFLETTAEDGLQEHLAPGILKKLSLKRTKIDETNAGLQLTLNQDVDAPTCSDDIENAKQLIKEVVEPLNTAREQEVAKADAA